MIKTPKHPYRAYEHHPAWEVVRKALAELEKNGDLQVATADTHLIGYLVKALDNAGCLADIGKISLTNSESIYRYLEHYKSAPVHSPASKGAAFASHVSEDPPNLSPAAFPLKKKSAKTTASP